MPYDEMDEKALERALSAPGSATELADEGAYLAMFRAAQSAAAPNVVVLATRRSTFRRLGTTASLGVVLVVATGGVAAAYSRNLPAPVQRAVHSVLAPLGVPPVEPKEPVVTRPPEQQPTPTPVAPTPDPTPVAPPHPKPSKTPEVEPSSTPSASPTEIDPSASPTDVPTTSPSDDPSSTESPSASPSASPSDTPSETVEPTPTTPPAPVPASLAISSAGAGQQVVPGGTAIVTGMVTTADGTPVSGVRVKLQTRGPSGWTPVSVAQSAADGSVAMSTGPVQRSTQVRLKAPKLTSGSWTLVVQPSLSAYSETNVNTATVTATANGGQSGDQVVLLTRRGGVLVQEGTARLDGSGRVLFTVAAPTNDRTYVVRLLGTQDHAEATAQVRVSGAPGL